MKPLYLKPIADTQFDLSQSDVTFNFNTSRGEVTAGPVFAPAPDVRIFTEVTNTGTTSGITFGDDDDFLTNTGTGIVQGSVSLRGGDDVINNDGRVIGNVSGGEGADLVKNRGEITGDVSMGDGGR